MLIRTRSRLAGAVRLSVWIVVSTCLVANVRAAEPNSSASQCVLTDAQGHSKTADQLLRDGVAAYEAGKSNEAEQAWRSVRSCPHDTTAWPKAVYNLGVLAKEQRDFPKAIADFEAVLQSHPNDKEAGGDIMEAYRNYSHRSAVQISDCYEEMGQYRQALHWALLAKNRFQYVSFCGTCISGASRQLSLRIIRLTAKTGKTPFLAFLFVAGGVICWRWTKRPAIKKKM